MTSAPAVQIARVSKHFGPHHALADVSLDVEDGYTTAIVGPSGCGKTTVLRLIAGLEEPDAGEIRLGGKTVSSGRRIDVPAHRRGIGFVFQDLALWPHMTVRASLEFVLRSSAVPRAVWNARTEDVLSSVHIADLGNRYPHQLSGGEQQRAALARALVGSPRLLLLDEPLSSLDADLRQALRSELAALRAARITMVHVTHDREEARALADRIVHMQRGRIVSVQAGS